MHSELQSGSGLLLCFALYSTNSLVCLSISAEELLTKKKIVHLFIRQEIDLVILSSGRFH